MQAWLPMLCHSFFPFCGSFKQNVSATHATLAELLFHGCIAVGTRQC